MPDYSIWALEFAQLPNYPDTALVYGKSEGARMLPFYYVLLQSDDHVLLIDAGFDNNDYGRDMIDRYGITIWKSPAEILPRVCLTPEDVDTIILTHHHFDHAGGLGLFPNAQVFVQRREIDNFHAKYNVTPRMSWLANGLDPDTPSVLATIESEGRLNVLDGPAEVLPGIDVRPAFDTHTAGSQYAVLTPTDGTPWIFPGDVVYVYDNLVGPNEDGILTPIGLGQGNQECCIRTTDEMLTAAGDDIRRILPWHEHRIWERYPSITFDDGLHMAEIDLAPNTPSRVHPPGAQPGRVAHSQL
ncbi:N-acyl homoserine lactonase family protein [Rhodococcus sp. NPDC127530]|uniref:N-acyl homoserine lactonase family protein n=1 Tax=unclassified Rhodococcus (in: high G+C Gram-positive bacteria) TaxID=192944 RepID=UPI003634AE85